MAEEAITVTTTTTTTTTTVAEEEETIAVADETIAASDHKRKLEDLEPKQEEEEKKDKEEAPAAAPAETLQSVLPPEDMDIKHEEVDSSVPEAKRPRLDVSVEESDPSVLENGHKVPKVDEPTMEEAPTASVKNVEADNAHIATSGDIPIENAEEKPVENPQQESDQKALEENLQTSDAHQSSVGDLQQPTEEISQKTDLSASQQQLTHQTNISAAQQQSAEISEQVDVPSAERPESESQTASRKMEIPNNKVGVLIGKGGDTIRLLQQNSGAQIQITRDSEANPNSTTRPVELLGSLENINKAEKLIKDVIAEAEAGGSPSLVARGFGTVQAGGASEQIEIQVPNEKVGLIIGKGGETIKSLQTRSGARIQLIPQHLPEGDQSKERIVRVTGVKKQIEIAKEMISEVMNQPVRHSSHSGGYNNQNYRARGPSGSHQWGPRVPSNAQATGYDYQQRGTYPSQNSQYMSQNYGGYAPQQPTPRNAGWEQRPSGPQGGGYDYYGQGGHGVDAPAAIQGNAAPAAVAGGPPPQVNYNYGQPQGPEYGQPPNYPQSAPVQQGYVHGYEDPKYANQVSAPPAYGGHGNTQAGAYPQQVNAQHGYVQQPYSKQPTYGMQSQGPAPQTYGPPRTGQPGDGTYQNPMPSTQSYGPNVPSQQSYQHPSGGPTQQVYPYGSAPVANDGYNQPPTGPTPVYPQQGGHPAPGYGQPGSQPAPGYPQGGQAGNYGQYPSSQQAYPEQTAPNSGSYGYQGPADAGYASAPASAYGAQPTTQANYVQPTANQPGYEQQLPQSGGYASVPGSAPVGYVKNLSPQPVYGQYDSTQMYGGHHQ